MMLPLGCTRRAGSILLVCLSLILVGTCVVLGSVWSFFHVDRRAMITREEVDLLVAWSSAVPDDKLVHGEHAQQGLEQVQEQRNQTADALASLVPLGSHDPAVGEGQFTPANGSSHKRPGERIPRLIHQTWKTDVLPDRWEKIRQECRAMHPDYDYILWTDANSRAFIEHHYPWFLAQFDAYPYPIQRADAIRYFVLHHFGGIYMDLDMGCIKPMDPLLHFDAIIPETDPIGVSNDLMLFTPQHPFMERLLTHLVMFNHNYVVHYATVMFSTGPMLVTASYALWVDANGISLPSNEQHPLRGRGGVRVLPKSLYGKNLPPAVALRTAFYKHFYGSSWHSSDATWVQALGKRGKYLFLLGCIILVYGLLRRSSLVPTLRSIRCNQTMRQMLGRLRGVRNHTLQDERETLLAEQHNAYPMQAAGSRDDLGAATRIEMPGAGEAKVRGADDWATPPAYQRTPLMTARTPSPSRFIPEWSHSAPLDTLEEEEYDA